MKAPSRFSLAPVRRLTLLCSFALLVFGAGVRGEDPPAPARPPRPERPERPLGEVPMEARRAELRELRESRERTLNELRELRAGGKEAEAAELKEQVVRLEREIAQRERSPGPGVRPRGERRERPLPEGNEPERRQQHLREAVEHLHAAGLPDLAERVGQAGQERLREQMRPQPGVPPEAIEQLHAQINELRETVKELQGQVEKLSRGKK